MAEQQKSAKDVAIESFHAATDGVLHVLAHAAEHYGKAAAEETLHGVSNALSVVEAAGALKGAVEAAAHGDWKEFGGKMAEVANVAPNMATMGIYGAIEAVWDSTVALRIAQNGGGDVTFTTLQKEGFDMISTSISDQIFAWAHPDAVADVRLTYTPDEKPRDVAFTSISPEMKFDVDIVSKSDWGKDVHPHHTHVHEHSNHNTMVFEPMVITLSEDERAALSTGLSRDHIYSQTADGTRPADQNTVFDPVIITLGAEPLLTPHIHDQFVMNAPDYAPSNLHNIQDMGLIPDGGTMLGVNGGAPDFALTTGGGDYSPTGGGDYSPTGGGDYSPTGGDISGATGDIGGASNFGIPVNDGLAGFYPSGDQSNY